MSLETKIRELMESKKAKASVLSEAGLTSVAPEAQPRQGDSKAADYTEIDPHTGAAVKPEDTSVKKGGAEGKVKQGDSKDAEVNQTTPDKQNTTTQDNTRSKGNSEPQVKQGNSRDATVKVATGKGTSTTGTFQQPTTPGEGQIPFKEEEEVTDDVISEEDIEEAADLESAETKADEKKEHKGKRKVNMNMESLRADIASVFAGDTNLSEDFKTQASAIFEAAVVARVNNEIEAITEELAEQAVQEINTAKEDLVEKVDSYLNYVVEQWMKDNEIAVEKGLRTEVAEDFMLGLKNLFQEHYFEVPEDKIDVLEDMATKVDEATAQLDETIQANIQLKAELDAVMRDRIIEQAGRGLTATDAEKLGKLLEGVEYGSQALFTEKVKVVKENYFPTGTPTSPEQMLEESVQHGDKPVDGAHVPAQIQRYVQALSRTVKK